MYMWIGNLTVCGSKHALKVELCVNKNQLTSVVFSKANCSNTCTTILQMSHSVDLTSFTGTYTNKVNVTTYISTHTHAHTHTYARTRRTHAHTHTRTHAHTHTAAHILHYEKLLVSCMAYCTNYHNTIVWRTTLLWNNIKSALGAFGASLYSLC